MNQRTEQVTRDLRTTADDVKKAFAPLSAEQLNWKPAPKSWSVAQCLDHLITTHDLYFPLFEKLKAGNTKPSFWEKTSPLSGFFGRFLINGLNPTNLKKMKTTGKAQPSSSEIEGDIVDRYVEHQARLADAVSTVPGSIDPVKTIITSPLLDAITYSLDDCYTILVYHGQRHFAQARRVTENSDFPN